MRLIGIPIALAVAGTMSMVVAIVNERRMHRHRQPGVTYAQATFRGDGGWRRTDLFTPTGLQYQRQASRYGVTGAALWVLAMLAWVTVALSWTTVILRSPTDAWLIVGRAAPRVANGASLHQPPAAAHPG